MATSEGKTARPGMWSPVAMVMSTRIVQILADIPLGEARAVAARYDYNGFPVVTREGRLAGILTKGDLLRAGRAAVSDATVWRHPVSCWMTNEVLSLSPGESILRAVERMIDTGLRSLPVVDVDDHPVGMVSRNDLMLVLSTEAEAG